MLMQNVVGVMSELLHPMHAVSAKGVAHKQITCVKSWTRFEAHLFRYDNGIQTQGTAGS